MHGEAAGSRGCVCSARGKLTPRHAMHLGQSWSHIGRHAGRTTARSLCSGGFLPPPPAHLGRAGVATLAEACPPCAGLAAFGAACCTARVSRVLRIVARRCVVAPRDRDLNATRSRRRWLAQAGGRFAAASRRPKTAAIARWSRRYGSEEKRAGRSSTRPSMALSSCCLTGSPAIMHTTNRR